MARNGQSARRGPVRPQLHIGRGKSKYSLRQTPQRTSTKPFKSYKQVHDDEIKAMKMSFPEDMSKSSSISSSGSSSDSDSFVAANGNATIPSDIWGTNDKSTLPPNKIIQGYPCVLPYGECFETSTRFTQINDKNNASSGQWTIVSRSCSMKSVSTTPLDNLVSSLINSVSTISEPNVKCSFRQNQGGIRCPDSHDVRFPHNSQSLSQMSYKIPHHLISKRHNHSENSSYQDLFFYDHPVVNQVFTYAWLQKPVSVFIEKMGGAFMNIENPLNQILVGATFLQASEFVHQAYDDIELIQFAKQEEAYLWHFNNVSSCVPIINIIVDILKSTFQTVSNNLNFDWQKYGGYQFLVFVTVHLSKKKEQIDAFEIESFMVYQYDEETGYTNILFQHCVAELVNTTMTERLMQLCQLLQYHRSDSESSAAISFHISNELTHAIQAYKTMDMTLVRDSEDGTTQVHTSKVIPMSKYSMRAALSKYSPSLRNVYNFSYSHSNAFTEIMQDVIMLSLNQFHRHPLHQGDKLHDDLADMLKELVMGEEYMSASNQIQYLVNALIEGSSDAGSFGLHSFAGIISSSISTSEDRLNKVNIHDHLLWLLSNISVHNVRDTCSKTCFNGDMNMYQLMCGRCDQVFGEIDDLITVLGRAASSIMDHYGLGFNWKDLYEAITSDLENSQRIFSDLSPILFSNLNDLLFHIERNNLHKKMFPRFHCAATVLHMCFQDLI